jgi:hypothetical protein
MVVPSKGPVLWVHEGRLQLSGLPLEPAEWPELRPFGQSQDTFTTVHMWSQIVGKIRLGLSPHVNHSWGCTLYVSTRGLTTSPIPYGSGTFAIEFDFEDHVLRISQSDGRHHSFPLVPMTVSEFYRKTMACLRGLDIQVAIYATPVEVEIAIPFAEDETHACYDADAIHRYWRSLVVVDCVFKEFRASFIGKASPVHFFWGAFDLAVSRFSGRTAPKHPCGAPNCPSWVMVEAYSHEVSSAGFWPGAGLGEAAFYAYVYPSPNGFRECPVQPESAYFHDKLGEFILPYEAVRKSADPAQSLLAFLQSTYEGAANLAKWDREALER